MAIKKLNAELVPKIRKLEVFARQSALSQYIEGNWTTTVKGQGIEFTGYRSYTYGDDASMIDWKASLRSKSLLVKEYEQEKTRKPGKDRIRGLSGDLLGEIIKIFDHGFSDQLKPAGNSLEV